MAYRYLGSHPNLGKLLCSRLGAQAHQVRKKASLALVLIAKFAVNLYIFSQLKCCHFIKCLVLPTNPHGVVFHSLFLLLHLSHFVRIDVVSLPIYRLITAYLLLRVNLNKIMHVR